MVNFCSVANCLNSSRNRPDPSFFCFRSEQNSRRLWKNFCRRSDPEFRNQKYPGICSAHFEAFSIKNYLGGRNEIFPAELPKYLNSSTNEGPVHSGERTLNDRKKQTSHEQCPEPKNSRVTKEGQDTRTQQATRQFFWTTIIASVFQTMTRELKRTFLLKI